MIGFTGFHVLNDNNMEALVTLAADGGSVDSVKYEYNTANLGRPCLAAALIEIKTNPHPHRRVAVAVYCSKKEAKRLIYPKTNRDEGLCHWVPGNGGGPKKEPKLFFADSFDKAMVFIDRETKRVNGANVIHGRSCDLQLEEYKRIRGYLLKQGKWPALIMPAHSFNLGLLYFLAVDKDMAHRLVYANKSKSARGFAKGEFVITGGSVTGRITSRTVDDNSARRSMISYDVRAGTNRDLSRVVQDYMSHYDHPESNDEEEVVCDDIDEEVNEVCGISEELIDPHVNGDPMAPTEMTVKKLRRRKRMKRDLEAAGPDFSAALREGIRAHKHIEEEGAAERAIDRMTARNGGEIVGDSISVGPISNDLTGWDWYDRPNDEQEAHAEAEEETPVVYHGQSLWGNTLDELATADPAEEDVEERKPKEKRKNVTIHHG